MHMLEFIILRRAWTNTDYVSTSILPQFLPYQAHLAGGFSRYLWRWFDGCDRDAICDYIRRDPVISNVNNAFPILY